MRMVPVIRQKAASIFHFAKRKVTVLFESTVVALAAFGFWLCLCFSVCVLSMQISAKIMKELLFFCRLLFHLCRFDRKAIRLLPLRLLLVVANVWFCIAGDGRAFLFALFTCNRLVRVASCLVNSFSGWLVDDIRPRPCCRPVSG